MQVKPPIAPGRQLLQLAENLFPDESERAEFLQAMMAGESREQAIVVLQDQAAVRTFPRQGSLDWQPDWVIRINEGFRPGKHPLHDKGAYYCMDFSSVFAASAMLSIEEAPRRVLDLCASPGGKAIFAWKAFHPELLIANETMRKRTSILINNFDRCQVESGMVGSADPTVWARRAPGYFDLVTVDAPCSGQSLLAKGDQAPGCFSAEMIDMCVGRQRRIMGTAIKCVAPGGHLLYMTCTYTMKENEKVIAWLLERYPTVKAVEVPHLAEFRSPHAEFPCYRLFPQSGYGAGAFVCLLQKPGERPDEVPDLEQVPIIWRFGDAPRRPQVNKPSTKDGTEPFEIPKEKPKKKAAPKKKVWEPRKPPKAPTARRGRNRK